MARLLFLLCGLLSSLAVGDVWPHSSFQTGEWHPPHLSLRKVGDTIDPGKIFVSVRNDISKGEDGTDRENYNKGTAPTIYDNNGDMVWQGPHEKTMDLKMQKLFGQDVITYWDGETGVLGFGYGRVHILDNTYKEIYTITLQDDFVTPTGHPRETYIDVHEHYITPRNTIIVSAINITQADLSGVSGGSTGMWVIVPLFYEIDIPTNQVLFKWDAMEHAAKIPLSKSKRPLHGGMSQAEAWDGYHMNSVTPTNDGYLVSIRYLWSTYYLNKDGSVRWQLSGANGEGDFKTTDVSFSWQHDARVYNETDKGLILTLFNNAATLSSNDAQTTGMAINVNLINMTATPIYNIADPLDNVISRTQGSFQFLDYPQTGGHIFMGYGSVCKVKEYDRDGNIVLAGQFGGLGQVQSYRAFKCSWHAIPHWAPRILVKHSPTYYTTDVYMSWNGATDYDNWVIMSVPHMNSATEQGTVLAIHDRTGFETHVPFENVHARYIMAVARQGEKVLRSSRVVPFT